MKKKELSCTETSYVKVSQLLHDLNYSLQSNRKTKEGEDHPDRDAQFLHINKEVKIALKKVIPVISVDTKKKELLGNYKNNGQQWLPAKKSRKVKGHDFPSPDIPRAFPYGIYDIAQNTGFVNIGTDHDTGFGAYLNSPLHAHLNGTFHFQDLRTAARIPGA